MTQIRDILEQAMTYNLSDLHISIGVPPIVRVDGRLREMALPPSSPQDTARFARELLSEAQFAELERRGELDVSLSPEGFRRLRMRLNVFRQRGTYCMAFRILNQEIPDFDSLGLPRPVIEGFCRLNNGLVLVTGPTGTGKTTTITAMLDWINHHHPRPKHIITIEDPIEYYHTHDRSIIHQREIGRDTTSWRSALRGALRQNPDIIFIGEMRDLDSISIALTAAETGHLVFSTLHTIGSGKTIDRIIDVFPAHHQQQVRTQLSMVLQGIVSQQLIPRAQGPGRRLAYEVLLMTPAVRNLIRENRIAQIPNAILTGSQSGMRTMDTSLLLLAQEGTISWEEARAYASTPEQFDLLAARA
jgi:twitching motility protein PilT